MPRALTTSEEQRAHVKRRRQIPKLWKNESSPCPAKRCVLDESVKLSVDIPPVNEKLAAFE
jgi:hypothetical protein